MFAVIAFAPARRPPRCVIGATSTLDLENDFLDAIERAGGDLQAAEAVDALEAAGKAPVAPEALEEKVLGYWRLGFTSGADTFTAAGLSGCGAGVRMCGRLLGADCARGKGLGAGRGADCARTPPDIIGRPICDDCGRFAMVGWLGCGCVDRPCGKSAVQVDNRPA